MLSRRDFLKRCRDISLLLTGSTLMSRTLADGFMLLAGDPPPIAFIHGQNCMGCTTSMMYGNDSDFVDFFSDIGRLGLHPALSVAQGEGYIAALDRMAATGDYLLVVEGSVPAGQRQACYLGSRPLYDVLDHYAARAKMVICSGSCASHGGIPASGDNLTGAQSVKDYLEERKVMVPILQLPGCPVHPDHLLGSLAYIAATGKRPPLVATGARPKEYFGELLHNQCSRYQSFTMNVFVEDFARDKKGCLLKQGCRGPVTYSDCPKRRWNQRTSVCIESNSPCIGCMSSNWPFSGDLYLDAAEIRPLPWTHKKKRGKDRQ